MHCNRCGSIIREIAPKASVFNDRNESEEKRIGVCTTQVCTAYGLIQVELGGK